MTVYFHTNLYSAKNRENESEAIGGDALWACVAIAGPY